MNTFKAINKNVAQSDSGVTVDALFTKDSLLYVNNGIRYRMYREWGASEPKLYVYVATARLEKDYGLSKTPLPNELLSEIAQHVSEALIALDIKHELL